MLQIRVARVVQEAAHVWVLARLELGKVGVWVQQHVHELRHGVGAESVGVAFERGATTTPVATTPVKDTTPAGLN